MAQHYDNPAGRLLEILRNAKSMKDAPTALVGWGTVFGLSPIDDLAKETELLGRLVELHKLIDTLEMQIGKIEEDEDRHSFLGPLERVPTLSQWRKRPVLNLRVSSIK